jgi:hypothetical protein
MPERQPIPATCEICNGRRITRVLDVWRISRAKQDTGVLPSMDTLPFVPGGAPCPKCVGEDEFDAAIDEMNRRWGDPYNPVSSSEDDA